MIQVWQPNTIPLPYPAANFPLKAQAGASPRSSAVAPTPVEAIPQSIVDVNDLFPKALISKYFQFQKYGFILDPRGKEIYFNLSEVDFVGAKGKEALRVGVPVGYDVSWTSHGLHVKKLKIY